MIEGSADLEWHGVRLTLLPDRAVFVPGASALLVADVHLGKPASFRASGVPVPEAVTARDLDRLSGLVGSVGPDRLIVLGDLIHDSAALRERTRDAVAAWRASLGEVSVELVPGNHDRKARSCEPLGVRVLEDEVGLAAGRGTLCLTHEPPEEAEVPTLCGHLHPMVSVGGRHAATRVRAGCFWFGGCVGILPAFGTFTGGHGMPTGDGSAVFAAGDRAVVPVTENARRLADSAGAGSAEAYDRA